MEEVPKSRVLPWCEGLLMLQALRSSRLQAAASVQINNMQRLARVHLSKFSKEQPVLGCHDLFFSWYSLAAVGSPRIDDFPCPGVTMIPLTPRELAVRYQFFWLIVSFGMSFPLPLGASLLGFPSVW